MIYGVAAAVPENDREGGKEREVDEGTKANRNSWCLNERGQLRLDIQSAERERGRERSGVGVDRQTEVVSVAIGRGRGDTMAELLLMSTRFRATMTTTKKDECHVGRLEGRRGGNQCMGPPHITMIRTGCVFPPSLATGGQNYSATVQMSQIFQNCGIIGKYWISHFNLDYGHLN